MALRDDFAAMGIQSGDTLLMHSSFRSLGPVDGGMAVFFQALLDVLGERGTLILPTLSYGAVTRENPVYDVNKTPSCVGAMPEYFRQLPGIYRSLSPTHSCAAKGYLAREITEGQLQDDTPLGAHSPFRRLAQMNGKTLFLGCSIRPHTMMHGVEEAAGVSYVLQKEKSPFTVIDETGKTHEIFVHRHCFRLNGLHYLQRYDRLGALLDEKEWKRGKIAQADCDLISARAAWDKALAAMKQDPYCFVEGVQEE